MHFHKYCMVSHYGESFHDDWMVLDDYAFVHWELDGLAISTARFSKPLTDGWVVVLGMAGALM